jgi:Flp pilus assembly protein CpaB
VLAAALAGVVVWGVVSAVRPSPAPTVPTLVATTDLVPGAVVREDDVALEPRPVAARPIDAAAPDAVVGRTVAFPVLAGEPLSARHVVGAELLAALGPGLVATPVALADPVAGALVARGDVVDVLAAVSGAATGTPSSSVVASRVRVLVAPVAGVGSETGALGALGSGTELRGSSALVLATTTEQALALARAAVGSRLSLTIRAS